MGLLRLGDPSSYHLARECPFNKQHKTVVPGEAVASVDNLANLELE
jgi:hypothetical protein